MIDARFKSVVSRLVLAAAVACHWPVGTTAVQADFNQERPAIVYEPATVRSHAKIERFLRSGQTLERIRQAVDLIKISRPISYCARSCGYIDA